MSEDEMAALAVPVAGLALLSAGVATELAAKDVTKAVAKKIKSPRSKFDKESIERAKSLLAFSKDMGKFSLACLAVDKTYNGSSRSDKK